MGNIFEHDAVPTWSGFVYQGRIAVYLAVKKLLKLKQSGSMDEIQHYSIEMEKCEDIAILLKKQSKEEYISIHQVKNYEHTAISKYREAAVQLMLEAGYYKEHGQGSPKAYLHVAKPLRTVNRSTSASIVFDGWASSVLDLFVDLGKWYSDLSSNNNVDEVFSNIESCDFEKILGINRSQLQGIIKSLTDSCKKKKQDNAEKYLGELIEFCKDELCVPRLVRDIELYEYSSGVAYCSGPDIYNKVFECVKEYKDASGLNNEQLEYLTNAIFCFVSDTILERHRLLQDKKPAPCSIPLEEFAKILDGSVEKFETKR
ncbi:MAG: hypothetical protein PHR06_10425 [Candidatus Cloacimonetes bacterium]|nr:hypothetical protein [Candidatus Cloacimonadota bacterium]